jgi:hypothetical protein
MDTAKLGMILFWIAVILGGLWLLASISWLAVKLLVLAGAVYGAIYAYKYFKANA